MELFYGVFFLCFSAVLWFIILVNVRNPKGPKWASAQINDDLVLPCMIVSVGWGGCSLFRFSLSAVNGPVDSREFLLSVATVVLSALLLLIMRIPWKLKQFKKLATDGQIAKKDLSVRPERTETKSPVSSSNGRMAA
jgi:hypothetical protein